jgi:hypothetical protein
MRVVAAEGTRNPQARLGKQGHATVLLQYGKTGVLSALGQPAVCGKNPVVAERFPCITTAIGHNFITANIFD